MYLYGLVVAGLVVGFVLGTFGEYWVHWAMHRGLILVKAHEGHHRAAVRGGHGEGILKQFRDAACGSAVTSIIVLPIDYYYGSGGALAIGVVLGTLIHAIFVAWCHQAQHEDPRLVLWLLDTPVHFMHHKLNQTHHNLSFSVDWWDRLFGTLRPEPNWRKFIDLNMPPRRWWELEWLDHRPKN